MHRQFRFCHWILAASLLPSLGCFAFDHDRTVRSKTEPPKSGEIHRVEANWFKDVKQITQGNGSTIYGLAGRIYLFGKEVGYPLAAHGNYARLVVAMDYVDRQGKKQQIQWEFKKDYLDQLLRHDSLVGWGYTIPLPWAEYRPDIKQVRMQAAYFIDKDHMIQITPSMLNLDQGNVLISRRSQVPIQEFRPGTSQGLAVGGRGN